MFTPTDGGFHWSKAKTLFTIDEEARVGDREERLGLRPVEAAVGGREHDLRAVRGKSTERRVLELLGEQVRNTVAVGADRAPRRSEPSLTVTAGVGRLDLLRRPRVAPVARNRDRQRRDLGAGVVVTVAPELREADVGPP